MDNKMDNTEQAIQFQADTDRYQRIASAECYEVESVEPADVNLFSILLLLFCISFILSLGLYYGYYYGYPVYLQLIGADDVNIIYDVLGA